MSFIFGKLGVENEAEYVVTVDFPPELSWWSLDTTGLFWNHHLKENPNAGVLQMDWLQERERERKGSNLACSGVSPKLALK